MWLLAEEFLEKTPGDTAFIEENAIFKIEQILSWSNSNKYETNIGHTDPTVSEENIPNQHFVFWEDIVFPKGTQQKQILDIHLRMFVIDKCWSTFLVSMFDIALARYL